MRHVFRRWGVAVLLVSGLLWGGETGKITGVVKDKETGEPLPSASVMIQGTHLGAAADLDGFYVILNVPPGTYTLEARMIGYKPMVVQGVKVRADQTTEVNFFLEPAVLEVEEPVVVVAKEPLVKKDVTSSVITVDREELQNLPVETFIGAVSLKAGVTQDPFGGIHIRGGRSGEVLYLVDGVPILDPFANVLTINVPNNVIKQLDLVAGTFNAEYGNAMSGVVNIVTDEGSNKLEGTFSAYTGDRVSKHTDIFPLIDRIDPTSTNEVLFNLTGPILPKLAKFFIGTRWFREKGWLYGFNVYTPTDQFGSQSGDGRPVPMNPYREFSGNAKLTFLPTGGTKLILSGFWSDRKWKSYSHLYKYNPLSIPTRHRTSWQGVVSFNHILSPKTFYTIRASYNRMDYLSAVYEDPFDTLYKYQTWFYGSSIRFDRGGVNPYWYKRWTKTAYFRADLQSQITHNHLVKLGVEGSWHELYFFEMSITNPADSVTNITLTFPVSDLSILPVRDTINHVNQYVRHPVEFAAYIQDKIELKDLVVNAGVRFDYFDPRAKVWVDPRAPSPMIWDTLRGPYPGFRDVKPSYKVSPRLGIAFPVSATGVFHFSYGHFFQIPAYTYLYRNGEYEWYMYKANRTWFGNPELKPQKTVAYEVGFKQAIGEHYGLEVIAYYKDIRDLVSSKLMPSYVQGDNYSIYVNQDYANVRGVSVFFKLRNIGMFSGEIDYTFQIAEGLNSSPRDPFYDLRHGVEQPKKMTPLDWDERHRINATLTLSRPGEFALTAVGSFGSGLPYTPTDERGNRIGDENSARKPPTFNLDLYGEKYFNIGRYGVTFFVKVYNVFDVMNERIVYSSTGRATYSRSILAPFADPGWYVRPHYFSPPRSVRIGFQVHF